MYLILDWDGTVTVRDTLWMLLERFGDREVFERMEDALGATHTHREVMEAEMATITAPLEEAVAFLVAAVEIRAGFRGVVERFRPLVYVGDGYSDRCAALAADRVFARGALAAYLSSYGAAFEPFEDFDDVAAALT